MRLIKSLVKFGRDATDYVSVLFDNSVEKKAVQRASELALEVARLEDRIDELKFNGPTLFRSEVRAIETAIALMHSFGDAGDPTISVLKALLNRSDCLAEIESIGELSEMAVESSELYLWGCDRCMVGINVDYNSNATLEVAGCAMCNGKLKDK